MADAFPGADLDSLIAWGREERNLEYKRSIDWKNSRAKLTKAILSMANIRGGGSIVVGVERQSDDSYQLRGMTAEHLASFVQDDISAYVNEYADPHIEVAVHKHTRGGKEFCVIRVSEFLGVPIVCKNDGDSLRRGAMYTRPRRKCESAEVPNAEELREILDMAVEKRSRAFSEQAGRMGYQKATSVGPYSLQLRALPENDLLKKIRAGGYWRVQVRPTSFLKGRFQDLTDCVRFMSFSAPSARGVEFPIVVDADIQRAEDSISCGG